MVLTIMALFVTSMFVATAYVAVNGDLPAVRRSRRTASRYAARRGRR